MPTNTTRSARIYQITATLSLSLATLSVDAIRELYPAADVFDLMICFAVAVGFFEQRPLNYTKLALFSGIPRPTVVRRVKRLVSYRILEFSSDRKTVITPKNRIIGIGPDKIAERYSQHIQNAAGQLNKMDT